MRTERDSSLFSRLFSGMTEISCRPGVGCFLSAHLGITCSHNFQDYRSGDRVSGRVQRAGGWIGVDVTLTMLNSELDIASFSAADPQLFSPLTDLQDSQLLFGVGFALGTAAAMPSRELDWASQMSFVPVSLLGHPDMTLPPF